MIKGLFCINGSYKITKRLALVISVASILLYHLIVINYYSNADGIIEGLYYYHNANWASSGCGRFLIRYLNYGSANIVMPLLIVVIYTICVFLSILIINNLWSNKSEIILYISSILMISSPAIIGQMSFMYMALAFGISCLFSTLFVYLIFKVRNIYGFIGEIFCIVISLGLYQSYIGLSACLTLFTTIIYVTKNEDIKNLLKTYIKAIIAALVGCISYLLVYKLDLQIYGLVAGDRASEFSLSNLLYMFPKTFIDSYRTYFAYFNDSILKRKYIYFILIVFLIFGFITMIFRSIKNKKYKSVLLIALSAYLIPPASNILGIVMPNFEIYLLMEYQCVLLIVFELYFLDLLSFNLIRNFCLVLCVALSWTLLISANATYRCYELSFNSINKQMQNVVDDIYAVNGYVKDETPVILLGFPSDQTIRNELPLYKYVINYPNNPAFWEDINGATNNRYEYFLNYFGINARMVDYQEYQNILNDSNINDMSIWPTKNSIKMIGGCVVVKLSSNY